MGDKANKTYLLLLAGAFILGACLRLYLLQGQILLDDEWHGLSFIKNRSFLEVITQSKLNPYSSPLLNAYLFLCYHGAGVSEWNMRLPLLSAGCAMVVILPLLVRKIVPERAGIIFSYLLAVSPFLVFYSRFSRTYILIPLLSFLGLIAAFRWASSGKRACAALFVLASTAAAYAHPSAVAMGAAPYAALAAISLYKQYGGRASAAWALAIPPGETLAVMLVHGVSLFAAVFNYAFNRAGVPLNAPEFSGIDILNILELISGTAAGAAAAVFFGLALFGCLRLHRYERSLAALLYSGVLVSIVFVLFFNPGGINCSAIFLRYCIAIIPLILLCAAVGFHELLEELEKRTAPPLLRRVLPASCICTAVFVLYVKGPLPVIYRAPNNFTGHLAFQGSYEYGHWSRSRSNHFLGSHEISRGEIPEFYRRLAADPAARAIIEYPFDFADHSNLLYFYQLEHRKRVFAGYCSVPGLIFLSVSDAMGARIKSEKLTLAYTRPDFFLNSAAVKSRTLFRNMVDLADEKEVLRSAADYLVLHKMISSVYIKGRESGNFLLYDRSVLLFSEHYKRLLGKPVYEDGELIVFRLPGSAGAGPS